MLDNLLKSERSSWPIMEVVDKKGNRRKVRINPEKLKEATHFLSDRQKKRETKSLEDADLIEKVVAGDERAKVDLYVKYKDDAFKIIDSFVKDKEISEDLTSDTFVKVFTKIDSYNQLKDSLPFKSWFIRIASNTARDYLRSSAHAFSQKAASDEEMRVNLNSKADSESPDSTMEKKEMLTVLEQAISKLPEEYASTIRAFYFEGKSIQEIAEESNISKSGVNLRLLRAKSILKNLLSPDLYKAAELQFRTLMVLEKALE